MAIPIGCLFYFSELYMDLDKDKFIKFYLIIQLHCRDGVGNLQSG